MPTAPNQKSAIPATSQKKSTVLAAVTAAADVVLGVLANQFFGPDDRVVWVPAFVAVGAAFVLFSIFNVRAENGERILVWARIRKIVAGRIFVAAAAALVAAGLTFGLTRNVGRPASTAADHSAPTSATPAEPTPAEPTSSASAGAAAIAPDASGSPALGGRSVTVAPRRSYRPAVPALPSSPAGTAGPRTTAPAIAAAANPATTPVHCDATNASDLLAARRPSSQEFEFSVGNGSFVGIDGSAARYSPIPANPGECKLNFELSDAEIQPLSGSKIGRPDGNGSCGATPTTSAMQVTREVPVRLCGYSARDNTYFAVDVTLSDDGIWTFAGA